MAGFGDGKGDDERRDDGNQAGDDRDAHDDDNDDDDRDGGNHPRDDRGAHDDDNDDDDNTDYYGGGGNPPSPFPFGGPVCFTPGTLIATPAGPRPVESLRPGDPVRTADNGDRPLRWIATQRLEFGRVPHKDKPWLIRAGCLGAGLPHRDLLVSPQHRVVLRGPEVVAMFGEPEVLAPARGLGRLPGVRQAKGRRAVCYISLLLDHHQVIFSEGAATESFYPGPTALAMLCAADRARLLALIPGLDGPRAAGYGPTARPVLTRREAQRLVAAMARRAAAPLSIVAGHGAVPPRM